MCATRRAQEFDDLLQLVLHNRELFESNDESPAVAFSCRTGKGRTTMAMAISSLIIFNMKVTASR